MKETSDRQKAIDQIGEEIERIKTAKDVIAIAIDSWPILSKKYYLSLLRSSFVSLSDSVADLQRCYDWLQKDSQHE